MTYEQQRGEIMERLLVNAFMHIYRVSMKSLYNFKNLLQSVDLFLWCYVKDIVYRTKVRDITNLKQRITDAIATTDEGMLQRTWQEVECRLDVLHATNGADLEVY
jgi:hypothetical protein